MNAPAPFRIGVDYYPEHWPESRWEEDARLMQEAGFNVVRLAEFAWARLEPREGVHDFAWLDRAIATLGRRGIAVVLGTPTASMPPWLARTYPEAVSSGKDGLPTVYGIRQNACLSSGSFRLLSERITLAMAEHYAGNPHVIGWQTDNEFTAGLCHCQLCRRSFQAWLRTRYGTLEELNRAWGTHFWNHIYGDWAEIPHSVRPDFDNPSLFLDWKRFGSDTVVHFQHDQVRILRQHCPRQFVTHNLMGFAKSVDYFDLARDERARRRGPAHPLPGQPHRVGADRADTSRRHPARGRQPRRSDAGPRALRRGDDPAVSRPGRPEPVAGFRPSGVLRERTLLNFDRMDSARYAPVRKTGCLQGPNHAGPGDIEGRSLLAFDAASRKTAETDAFAPSGGQTFGYDTASRLTSCAAGAAAAQSWILTKVGDWTSTTRDGVTEAREHKPVHEATQVGPNILSYDPLDQLRLLRPRKGQWRPVRVPHRRGAGSRVGCIILCEIHRRTSNISVDYHYSHGLPSVDIWRTSLQGIPGQSDRHG